MTQAIEAPPPNAAEALAWGAVTAGAVLLAAASGALVDAGVIAAAIAALASVAVALITQFRGSGRRRRESTATDDTPEYRTLIDLLVDTQQEVNRLELDLAVTTADRERLAGDLALLHAEIQRLRVDYGGGA